MQIIDNNGKILQTISVEKTNNILQLPVNQLVPGIYYVSILSKKAIIEKKQFIVE